MTSFKSGYFTRNRVEAFSDGVFAIIVTLLVFELKLPDVPYPDNASIMIAIGHVLPKIVSWVISFLIVCVIWMNHHRLMDQLRGIDAWLFWLNNVLLMFTSLIPFPTAVLGDYPNVPLAAAFYGFCLSLMGLCFVGIRMYVIRHTHLLADHVNLDGFRRATRLTLLYGPLLYMTGAAAAWVHPWISFAVYLFIPLYFILPRASTGS